MIRRELSQLDIKVAYRMSVVMKETKYLVALAKYLLGDMILASICREIHIRKRRQEGITLPHKKKPAITLGVSGSANVCLGFHGEHILSTAKDLFEEGHVALLTKAPEIKFKTW